MEHILLNKSLIYKKRREINPPQDYTYNSILGIWINPINNLPLILSKDYQTQGTKKFDQETGEDHKGQ